MAVGPVNPKLGGPEPSREPPKKELSSLGYVWKSFIEFPANLYLLMLRISSAMTSALSSSTPENVPAITKAVDLSEPSKKMNSIVKEIESTELTYVNGLKELMRYKEYFDTHSDKQIIRSTGIKNLQEEDLKNIREYLQSVSNFFPHHTAYYDVIKNISREHPEEAVDVFTQLNLREAYKPIPSKLLNLSASTRKSEVKQLFTHLQSKLFKKSEKSTNPRDLFITPIQRIPRYIMLFKEMGKEAEKAQLTVHQKQVIKNGMERAQNIADAMNAP